ncbi:hydroxylamine reductase [Austwickia chelonae]|uniref:Hydroxylamine reductase n=1 Tax=Austwickia chelonae NBRC 105200 TaxID=1184607 RepID=K6WA01_9MICO|nr:hydroxylamine reductase [Austwickia chelonae]GAB78662.1 hydroxylamine reductase [Austwickia chelonae NBRC 105200]SEW34499.1 hydroxylamine reductase [Austwickia chelonae]
MATDLTSMFCYQCEQTAHGTGCVTKGICGKSPAAAEAQDELTYETLRLAAAIAEREGGADSATEDEIVLIMEALFTTITNVSFGPEASAGFAARVDSARRSFDPCPERTLPALADHRAIFGEGGVEGSCRSLLILGLRGMAAYAHHAYVLGYRDGKVDRWLVHGLAEAAGHHDVEGWLGLLHDFGLANFACMELLDRANTASYGTPEPTSVTMDVEPGPFVVVTGHDLHDMKMLLEQCQEAGVDVYTHGEMLPGHAYPELKKYSVLKGNFGTAWQNQQKEFKNVPGAFLFTTNCLMPPRWTYQSNIFTTSVVEYPGVAHIPADENGWKDFSPVIARAKELGGWSERHHFSGINGGSTLTTGFGHGAVLAAADQVVAAIKDGALKHIYLVGGCDGREPGRDYYTHLVEQTPADSLVLTLACGKYRFNDLDLGNIGPFPRIMDMGQCNDAYSAVKVASALAEVFECSINDLPLTLMLSWYEQKAVCVLLSLLSLGVKNIYLGPTLPAFVSPEVFEVLVSSFGLRGTTTPEQDLAAVAGS